MIGKVAYKILDDTTAQLDIKVRAPLQEVDKYMLDRKNARAFFLFLNLSSSISPEQFEITKKHLAKFMTHYISVKKP